ncbi:ribosome recycling factor [Salinicoccus roseus]|jgi:ribosome recycling factor|uniref:Ribosome-recycling factor n=1 Tax=Salinicoccus roseus TaxID=45670 RepID=A0A265E9V1_9STAP|nr:ribosome recycling factor [Salinicoccus roseus]MBY8909793.1 ribosome recycling factor [Salinicoccus roseus]OZT78354.1 ribosome recycling factor [Salinicoccus roseus]RPE54441.1 ribosome recycling factor [Salinicoccus roseus]GGA65522.1 ribosome-recycling factor [Salinicoccus roseus]
MSESVLKDAKSKMQKSLESLSRELATIRTGRANSNMLDRVTVDYYGAPTPVNQLAGISVPEARMLTVTPYDKGSVDDVLKAIQQADLGVNPTSDGTMIRITVPQLTEERRKEFVKDARKEGENAKVAVRNIRRDANDELKRLEKDGELTEDDLRSYTEDVQQLTNDYIDQIDKMCDDKETDIMEV